MRQEVTEVKKYGNEKEEKKEERLKRRETKKERNKKNEKISRGEKGAPKRGKEKWGTRENKRKESEERKQSST